MDCKLPITAAILAGGKNRRFQGKIKSFQLLNNKTLLNHQLEILRRIFKEVIIITNDIEAFQSYSQYKIFSDIITDKGPLGGIHSAIKNASCNEIFIVAGDMPFLNDLTILTQAVIFLKESSHSLIPKHADGIEPLHGFYSKKAFSKLEVFLSSKTGSVRSFLELINTSYWIVDKLNDFTNINSPKELECKSR